MATDCSKQAISDRWVIHFIRLIFPFTRCIKPKVLPYCCVEKFTRGLLDGYSSLQGIIDHRLVYVAVYIKSFS